MIIEYEKEEALRLAIVLFNLLKEEGGKNESKIANENFGGYFARLSKERRAREGLPLGDVSRI